MKKSDLTLGVVQMANRPLTFLGNLGNPRSYPYPVVYRTAKNAFTTRIMQRDPAVGDEYLRQARILERQGVGAILTTCGFNVVYQQKLATHLKIPVATSSLLALPMALATAPGGGRIGVITYDTTKLTRRHLLAAGLQPGQFSRLVVDGLDGTESWRQFTHPTPVLPLDILEADTTRIIRRLLRAKPRITAFLFECSGLCPLTARMREKFGLPIYDFLTVADALMTSVGWRGVSRPAR